MQTNPLNETDIQSVVDITATKRNVILDSQVLTALMKCGRYTDFVFNHNFQSISGKGNSLEIGSIIHKFLETYRKHRMHGLDRDKSIGFAFSMAELYIQGCEYCTNFEPYHFTEFDAKNMENYQHQCNDNCIIKPKCGHPINEYPGVKNTPPEPDKSNPQDKYKIGWKWVLETCKQYMEYYRNDHWVTLGVEEVRSKVLYEDDSLRILWKAKLDWIVDTNQGIYPCDTKTMKQNRDAIDLNNQFMGQCLIMDSRSIIIDKVGLQTTLKPEEKFKRVPISYSIERLIEWQSEILPYYSQVLINYAETGYWPPNFTSCEGKYGKCNFSEICRTNPELREEVLRQNFIVGPEWNPTNENED